jgi:hypothetical protein
LRRAISACAWDFLRASISCSRCRSLRLRRMPPWWRPVASCCWRSNFVSLTKTSQYLHQYFGWETLASFSQYACAALAVDFQYSDMADRAVYGLRRRRRSQVGACGSQKLRPRTEGGQCKAASLEPADVTITSHNFDSCQRPLFVKKPDPLTWHVHAMALTLCVSIRPEARDNGALCKRRLRSHIRLSTVTQTSPHNARKAQGKPKCHRRPNRIGRAP